MTIPIPRRRDQGLAEEGSAEAAQRRQPGEGWAQRPGVLTPATRTLPIPLLPAPSAAWECHGRHQLLLLQVISSRPFETQA